MSRPILQVRGLQKSFKGRMALKGVSFDVHDGEIFCLLGPNGAGKTTTINILSTALKADGGDVYFRDEPVTAADRTYRAALGIVPQNLAIYEEIPARDNVAFFASLYGLRGRQLRDNVQRALDFVGLADRQNDKPNTFSGGMKRRLNIACAIAHNPQIIIMDEPTVGIDPQSRTHILDSIKALRDAGATVIYTTHYMEEVEAIATRIVIMDHGDIIAQGTKESLKESLDHGRVYKIEVDGNGFVVGNARAVSWAVDGDRSGLRAADGDRSGLEAVDGDRSGLRADGGNAIAVSTGSRPNEVVDALYTVEGVRMVEWADTRLEVSTTPGIENLDKIIAVLLDNGCKIRHLTTSAASLETVFLQLTGRTLRD